MSRISSSCARHLLWRDVYLPCLSQDRYLWSRLVERSSLQWKHELLILSNPKTSCMIVCVSHVSSPYQQRLAYLKTEREKRVREPLHSTEPALQGKNPPELRQLHCSLGRATCRKQHWSHSAALKHLPLGRLALPVRIFTGSPSGGKST